MTAAAKTLLKNTYYITFRIHKDPMRPEAYGKRLDALTEAIRVVAVEVWWKDPTSYIMFWSSKTIDEIALAAKAAVDPKTDMALIAMVAFQDARLIGHSPNEADLLKLMPFVKKL